MASRKVLAAGLFATAVCAVVFLAGPQTGLTQIKLFRNELAERFGQDETHAKLNSGHDIPLLGWGSSGATGEIATAAVQTAVFAGFRHIDAAEMYGNEEALGKGLQMVFKNSNVRRKDLFIVSKVGNNHHAAADVLKAAQTSLANLQLDYLDLYHIHWPNSQEVGPDVSPPFNETWAAMEDLVDKGLVKSIGVSNFSPEKIQILMQGARIKPAVNQVEVHCHFRNQRVIDWCKQEGIHVTAYAPLSSPSTVSKMGKDLPNLLKDEQVADIAKKNGKTPAQVLLQWGLQHGTSVIPKSGNARHIKENQGVWGWSLPKEDYDALSSLKFQKKYFDGDFVMNKDGPYCTYEDLWDEPEP